MIALNNGISGISSILGALTGTQETNDTETATSLEKKYETAAQNLLSEYGFNNKLNPEDLKSSSFLNGFSVANKAKLTEHLGKLSLSEIVALFRNADKNRNGEVTATERRQYLQTLNGYIADGKSKEEIQALNNAQFLKNGGTVSKATKEKWLAEFEEYNIDKLAYTPDEKTATAEGTDWPALLEKLGPGLLGLIQNPGGGGGGSSSVGSSSVASLPQVPSLASMTGGFPGIPQASPTPSFEEMARLAGLTGAIGLDGRPLNAFGFLPQGLPSNPFGGASTLNTPFYSQGLGTNPFGGASTLNTLLAGSNNRLPQQPFAQQNLGLTQGTPSGFAFSPASSPVATEGTAPALPTPDVATTPAANPAVPAVDPWAPPTPMLLAQALPPQALPQAPAPNGGW